MSIDVRQWLEAAGFGAYADRFVANEIDAGALLLLTDEHLRELGIPIGPRAKLLKAIAQLAATASTAEDRPPAGSAGAAAARGAADAERRQLTVMFVDLVGSTALSARLDPEDLRDVIRAYQDVVATEVARYDGHVAQYLGDGALVFFGYPTAHEDNAERAVRAALAVQGGVNGLRMANQAPLAARIGISTGLVVVGDLLGEGAAKEHAVVGETPNLAARLQSIAMPGQVVVGAATRDLIGRVFELQPLAPVNLKGIDAPVRAYTVVGERSVESRFDAQFGGRLGAMVGRDSELAFLQERWRAASAGQGQLVVLTGDAGIGKSRILRALQDQIRAEPHVRLHYQCSPHHTNSTFFPVAQQLARAAGITPADSGPVKLDRLEALLGHSAASHAQELALIAAVLGVDGTERYGRVALSPEQQRQRTFDALIDPVTTQARTRPVLVVVEDVHWIDPTTLELTELTARRCAALPVMIVATARSSNQLLFSDVRDVSRLTLNRLGPAQIAAVVSGVAGGKALPESLVQEIAAKTDGVPLFAEELTKAMLESGELQETKDAFVVDESLHRLSVPASLQDSLMARLDRLQPVKEVAQTAACIGREFDFELLAAILPMSEQSLRDALGRLSEADLVLCHGSAPHARFAFRHALVRDAAYESLLRSKRQTIHGRLTAALETMPGAPPEILAHHAAQAGLTEKAIGWWQKAAARAVARPAYKEAIAHLTQAIRLAEQMGDDRPWLERRLGMLLALGQASIPSRGYGHSDTVAAFTRAQQLAERMVDAPHRITIAYAVWGASYLRGEQDKALATARDMVAMAERDRNEGHMITALRSLGISQMITGAPALAEESFRQALQRSSAVPAIPREQRVALAQRFAAEPGIATQFHHGLTLWCLGHVDQARAVVADALVEAREMNHVHTLVHALAHSAIFAVLGREAGRARALSAETIAFAEQYDLEMWQGYGSILHAFALALAGDAAGSVPIMERGLAQVARTQTSAMVPVHHALHARTLATLGRFEDAHQHAEVVRRELRSGSERYLWPECQRLLGDYLSLCPDTNPADVEAAYRRGLELAREQQAVAWELYCALSLARRWAERGDREQAIALLAPVRARFAAGSDLPACIDATALLHELGYHRAGPG
jgi:predicted ATPase/class 3 adenylate cyclase